MDNKTEYTISLKDLFTRGIDNADKATAGLEGRVNSLNRTLANIGLTVGIASMAKGIFDAGTNMEGLNISLKTMLGSKAEADKLVAQMVEFAATTPFQQSEVQTAGKQLLAYGIEAKNIIPTLRQLGDVSAGLNQPIGEIAYLYGTIRTQGKAMTVDIRQFANRGIPIYEELSKITGKTGLALQDYIEKGKIGFPEIQKAFENMSGAGGKFAGLTSELAKTTGGQWSNTKDQLEQLAVTIFNDLQPAINWFIGAMQRLIVHVREFIKWMKEHKELVKGILQLATVIGAAVAAYKTWMFVIEGVRAAQVALNLAMTLNPIGAVIAAVAALAAAIYLVIDNYRTLKEEYNKGIDKALNKATEDETQAVLDLAKSYEKLGYSKQESQKIALNYERRMVQAEFEAAKKSADEAAELTKKRGYGPFGMEKLQEDYRQKLRVLNVVSAKRNALFGKDIFGTSGAGTPPPKGLGTDTGTDKVKGTSHNVITINIDKLIEKFSINSSTIAEGAGSMKEQIVKALIEAVNDAQIIAGI